MAYSRAVRKGPLIEISGTTATSANGQALYPGDAYQQAKHALGAMVEALEDLGGSVDDVVRTRIFLKNIDDFAAVARAHDELLHHMAPASSALEVSQFLLPELLVELEATAYVSEGKP